MRPFRERVGREESRQNGSLEQGQVLLEEGRVSVLRDERVLQVNGGDGNPGDHPAFEVTLWDKVERKKKCQKCHDRASNRQAMKENMNTLHSMNIFLKTGA